MVNPSDVFGTVTITAPNPRRLAQFLYLQEMSNKSNKYRTRFSKMAFLPFDYVQSHVNEYAEQSGNQTKITLTFYGTDRWDFQSNIHWFYDILKEDTWSHDNEWQKIAKLLKNCPFEANFTVINTELNGDFVVSHTQETKWDHVAGQAIFEPEVYKVNIGYTASNLIRYNIYSEGNVWDLEYVRDRFDIFIDHLKNEYLGDDSFLNIRQNILGNIIDFEIFINTRDFEHDYVCHDLEEFLLEVLKLTPETKF